MVACILGVVLCVLGLFARWVVLDFGCLFVNSVVGYV